MKRPLCVLAAAMVAAVGIPATYTVEPIPGTKQVRVTIMLDEGEFANEFRMPAWAPGDYEIFNYGSKISEVEFSRPHSGSGIEGVHAERGDDVNHWKAEGPSMVTYVVDESRGNFSPNLRVTPNEIFVSGPGVLGWFVGHADEQHTLIIKLPTARSKAACALDPIEAKEGYAAYHAEDYDELIDSPFVVGDYVRVYEFEVGGKPHAIVGFNKSAGIDLKSFADVAAHVIREAKSLFGELPYDRYLFMFDFGGPGGGLEHLDSTRIGRPATTTASQARGIMFHEYVHTFNVKRIRSRALKPFDYTKPAVTGSLWWFEGVTDYYAQVFACRAGVISQRQFYSAMGGSIMRFSLHRQINKISADESSRRVWEVRRSNGYGFSYYTKGRNVGVVLDLAIRGHSRGAYSLDNVMLELYNETKNGPGFEEGRIRELCIKYGGGALADIYDSAVLLTGSVPYTIPATLCGLKLSNMTFSLGQDMSVDSQRLGKAWPFALNAPVAKMP
ncbi:MAG: M61 family metallopeptidase [Armatimonadetes bacterium]|nr:M61 family metallopeptidase [Armatimonadota bacterium]